MEVGGRITLNESQEIAAMIDRILHGMLGNKYTQMHPWSINVEGHGRAIVTFTLEQGVWTCIIDAPSYKILTPHTIGIATYTLISPDLPPIQSYPQKARCCNVTRSISSLSNVLDETWHQFYTEVQKRTSLSSECKHLSSSND